MEITVQATLAGIHPRSEELVQATRDADRGRADARALADARRRDAQALVDVQAKAGVAYVSDGLLGFQDLFRPFAERLQGLRVGPLTRWFDNNTFFRQPVVEGPIVRTQPVLQPYLQPVKLPKGARAKAILPGPYTFAKLADVRAYDAPEKAIAAFARQALAPEVRWLAEQGYGAVQFQEPCLAKERPQPEELEALQRAYLDVLDGVRITSSVVASFGDATPILEELLGLPVDLVGVDFTETPLDALADLAPARGLQAGLADARSSIVERPGDLAEAARELLETVDVATLVLAPSAELEFLPRALADEKLLALGEAARAVQQGVA